MNNISEIKRLLERYYCGESTEEEERRLRSYFAGPDVADELRADMELFRSLDSAAMPGLPAGLEERLSNAIDSWEAEERKNTAAVSRRRPRRARLRLITGIAASFMLVVALGLFMLNRPQPAPTDRGSDLTAEETYAHTKKAMQIFAHALNAGADGVEKVDETSAKVRRQMSEQLRRINSNNKNNI